MGFFPKSYLSILWRNKAEWYFSNMENWQQIWENALIIMSKIKVFSSVVSSSSSPVTLSALWPFDSSRILHHPSQFLASILQLLTPTFLILSHVIIQKPNLKSLLWHPRHCQVIRIAFPFRQFSTVVFIKDEVVSLMANPNPGGPGLRVYVPQRQGSWIIPLPATRQLRHLGIATFHTHLRGPLKPS